MVTATRPREQALFVLTGQRLGDGLAPIEGAELWPAPLATLRDRTRLRHDFPLVLADHGEPVRPLTQVVDGMLGALAPRGVDGERLRRLVLRTERAMCTRAADGAAHDLDALWAEAARSVAAEGEPGCAEMLARAGAALGVAGHVVDCTPALPAQLLSHLWREAHAEKARAFRAQVDPLVQRLADILRAAHVHSAAGRAPQALQAAVGDGYAAAFDFDVMSRLTGHGQPREELPPDRRARIESVLAVLRAQTFYVDPALGDAAASADAFHAPDCEQAAARFRARLAEADAVVRAMAVGRLEADGAYVPAEHDAVFSAAGDGSRLTADDLRLFPDYLVCIAPDALEAPGNAALLQLLSSGLPVKVLVQPTDLMEDAAPGAGHFAFGVRSARLATTAMGLGGMFVLQAAASSLHALRARLRRGLRAGGPALFSIYAGDAAGGVLPPHLQAALAAESRAFPGFSYDAEAGTDWATRFSLEDNRDRDADWVTDGFSYADADGQRATAPVRLTIADFLLCDRRAARHFARVPREAWHDDMVPAADWLELPDADAGARVPWLWAVDPDDRLERVVVDRALMGVARRSQLLWRRLQEHAGIHDAYAERLLAREKAAWEAQHAASAGPPAANPTPAADAEGTTAPAASASPLPATPVGAADPDEPWIETARCPSCNECQQINDRMFAYNDNRQAFIRDKQAGTFRQMVEAAESCQVSIIHPGRPWNSAEPGLDELIERAKPFR